MQQSHPKFIVDTISWSVVLQLKQRFHAFHQAKLDMVNQVADTVDQAVDTVNLNQHTEMDTRYHTVVAVAVTVHHPSSERSRSPGIGSRYRVIYGDPEVHSKVSSATGM